jgi:two-component system, NarL family, sensor kinase
MSRPESPHRAFSEGTAERSSIQSSARPWRRSPAQQYSGTRWLLLRFTGAGLAVLVALAGLIGYLAREAGIEQATDSAREATFILARAVAEPRLTPGLIAGDPDQLAAFDAAMDEFALKGSLMRVKVWDENGSIVYSDEPRLIGRTFEVDDEELEELRTRGTPHAEVSDLTRPENQYEIDFDKMLEVYVGVKSTSGQPLLFEAYFQYDGVTDAGRVAWQRFAPPSLGALLALQLVQIPLAWSLSRRLQAELAEREGLLRFAVESSNAERRRIAGDLHDGVIQELTGLKYALDAMRLSNPAESDRASLIAEGAAQLRGSIGSLRTLVVDIYPPDLAETGLAGALSELAAGLEQHGVQVTLDTDIPPELPVDAAALCFRVAQETVRNVINHSGAENVTMRASVDRSRGLVGFSIDDDGRGFDEATIAERREAGHLGLRSIGDLITNAGGTFVVRSAPGQGTRVDIEVPY